MNKEIKLEAKPTLSINIWDFITGMFIMTTIMFFASQTSAYLVRRAEGNWSEFTVPQIFWYSTGLLVLSSVFMQLSYFSAKKDQFNALKLYISITFALGIAFLIMQWYGYVALVDQKVFLVGNPSGSFIYIWVFFHAIHLLAGLTILTYVFVYALRANVHKTNLTLIRNCNTFWHFLDLLWVYLFMFLIYFR
jgi:cytochrome c oxidase subunit III